MRPTLSSVITLTVPSDNSDAGYIFFCPFFMLIYITPFPLRPIHSLSLESNSIWIMSSQPVMKSEKYERLMWVILVIDGL